MSLSHSAVSVSLCDVSHRALQVCEQKPLYLALLGILERSQRTQLAGEVWRTATKKFNTSCKVSRNRRQDLLILPTCEAWHEGHLNVAKFCPICGKVGAARVHFKLAGMQLRQGHW